MSRLKFDIKFKPQIESGEYKVETRDGKPARILCWDKVDECGQYIVALVQYTPEHENMISVCEDGIYKGTYGHGYDLFIITQEPELSEFEERIFKLLCQYKECDIPLTPENIKSEASMLWTDFEKYFFDLYGKEGEGDSALRSFYYKGLADGKAEALRTRATELTENLAKSGLDIDSIPYHLIEFMCNLYDCLNWKEIEETAEAYVTRIKAKALKDLPRWGEAVGRFPVGRSIMFDEHGFYIASITKPGCLYITFDGLAKLPGFKEDWP